MLGLLYFLSPDQATTHQNTKGLFGSEKDGKSDGLAKSDLAPSLRLALLHQSLLTLLIIQIHHSRAK